MNSRNYKFFKVLSFVLTLGISGSTMAVTNGVLEKDLPESERHYFSGNLIVPFAAAPPEGCPEGTLIRYASCTGSLIDPSSVSSDATFNNLTQGRLFLTAGHCTIIMGDFPGESIVHFANDKIRNDPDANNCRPGPLKGANDGINQYKVVASWTGLKKAYSGLGVGVAKDDWGLILLDRVVSTDDVPVPAKIAPVNPKLTVKNIPRLGLAGYGINGWGSKGDGMLLGQPLPVGGFVKMFVIMDTKSIQATNIISTMVAARGDETACNGDSGGGLFLPLQATNGINTIYTIYGLVANGDFNCRATNTSTRVDTQAFRDFVKSNAESIKSEALAHPPVTGPFPE